MNWLAYQSGDQHVVARQTANSKEVRRFEAALPSGSVFSPDSQLMILSDNQVGLLYRLSPSSIDNAVSLLDFPLTSPVYFMPASDYLVNGSTQFITMWTTNSGLKISPESYRFKDNCKVWLAGYSGQGEFMAAGSNVGVFTDSAASDWLCKLNRHPRALDDAYLEEEGLLVYGLSTGQVERWRYKTGSATAKQFEAAEGAVFAVALSPDGWVLATGGEDGVVKLWDLSNDELLRTLDHHSGAVYDLAFSNDGKLLFSAGEDGTVQAWGLLP
jgi:WD40 repeat protein